MLPKMRVRVGRGRERLKNASPVTREALGTWEKDSMLFGERIFVVRERREGEQTLTCAHMPTPL